MSQKIGCIIIEDEYTQLLREEHKVMEDNRMDEEFFMKEIGELEKQFNRLGSSKYLEVSTLIFV